MSIRDGITWIVDGGHRIFERIEHVVEDFTNDLSHINIDRPIHHIRLIGKDVVHFVVAIIESSCSIAHVQEGLI